LAFAPAQATGVWTATGSMATARYGHTATLLPNGQVLVTGGNNFTTGYLASAELYDPATGVWTTTGSLANARNHHPATLLPNGQVLVAGGAASGVFGMTNFFASAELYDPATGVWTATGSMDGGRGGHTATLLSSGKVLVAGGFNTVELSSAELYDPATGVWTATGSMANGRGFHTATLLQNGQVLVVGGSQEGNIAPGAELYDPATGMWTATSSMGTARYLHTATLLPNGQVLVSGGHSFRLGILAQTQLYTP